MRYIVSVGYQHDMIVNVWEWKKDSTIASNKVSSKVTAVSFSEDSSYFVTVGNRHVKFWYLDASKERRINATVPLIGRSGLLGELRNNYFCGVACGRGKMAGSTFCITSAGLLCQFNEKRLLDKWIDLRILISNCISVSEEFIFCGCGDGTVRVFKPQNLHYITSLSKPHYLGVDVAKGIEPSLLFTKKLDAVYPDTIALSFDPQRCWLSCVYSDHSLYVWDVNDTKKVGKVWSGLFHSSCVWSVEVYPDLEGDDRACFPPGSFLTCSSDNTIRLWNMERNNPAVPHPTAFHRNIYSHDLHKVVYVDDDLQFLQCTAGGSERLDGGSTTDMKSGIRVMKISPDGQHLASGDRRGNLRIHDLHVLHEILKVEAHDAEVLCLEYFKLDPAGLTLLASASRDRLIHILNVDNGYSLEQTLDDHSSSITAVKIVASDDEMRMISCGADKSIYFRTAQKSVDGIQFSRTHHVVGKTTLYDMDIDSTHKYAAVGCQDRNIRVYNVISGKEKRCFKGAQGEDGTLLKVQMDPSGTLLATSCTDKNISIFDFYTGECVGTMFGHSELVTGMKFTNDCRYLITVSGDSCIFVWRLDSQMTDCMRNRLEEIKQTRRQERTPQRKQPVPIRRETYIAVPCPTQPQIEEEDDSEEDVEDDESLQTPIKDPSGADDMDPAFLLTNGGLPLWAKRLEAGENCIQNLVEQNPKKIYRPHGRWAESADQDLLKRILETMPLQPTLTPTPSRVTLERGPLDSFPFEQEGREEFKPQNLENLLEEMESAAADQQRGEHFSRPDLIPLENIDGANVDLESPDSSENILYPLQCEENSQEADSDYQVKELHVTAGVRSQWKKINAIEKISPDSACCVGSADSQSSSVEQQQDDVDSLGQLSSDEGSSELEEETEEVWGSLPQEASIPQTPEQEKFLKQHFETLAEDLIEEKFDRSPKDLKPTEDHGNDIFLHPRLSISARFLSRCQKNSRLLSAFPSRVQQQIPELGEELKASASNKRQLDVNLKPVVEGMSKKDFNVHCAAEPALGSVMSKAQSSILNMQEGEKVSSKRISLQPSTQYKETSQNKTGRERSFMVATASSRAKMSRSQSMGENLNLKSSEEQSKQSFMSRATSNMDLVGTATDEQKEANTENLRQDCKENLPPKQNGQNNPSYGNHQARVKLTLNIQKVASDQSLMPPPLISAVTKVKQKPHEPLKTLVSAVTPTEMKSLGIDKSCYVNELHEIESCRKAGARKKLEVVTEIQNTPQSKPSMSSESKSQELQNRLPMLHEGKGLAAKYFKLPIASQSKDLEPQSAREHKASLPLECQDLELQNTTLDSSSLPCDCSEHSDPCKQAMLSESKNQEVHTVMLNKLPILSQCEGLNPLKSVSAVCENRTQTGLPVVCIHTDIEPCCVESTTLSNNSTKSPGNNHILESSTLSNSSESTVLSSNSPKSPGVNVSESSPCTADFSNVVSAEQNKPFVPYFAKGMKMEESEPVKASDLTVNVQNCEMIVSELRSKLQTALQIYSMVAACDGSPEEQLQMKSILQEAFNMVRKELDWVEPQRSRSNSQSISPLVTKQLKDSWTEALLERYSEMLLAMMQKKMADK
nr:PREDICTED: mitogen-activated protein kinase-binding protein 1-like isoform X1 [Latimeria chalumnae]|eukprot:XP_006013149.1 PREDICTED: mitogen-activated protein kinase-binding protein 1-like isoform X1 [Latimeria chalumnae]